MVSILVRILTYPGRKGGRCHEQATVYFLKSTNFLTCEALAGTSLKTVVRFHDLSLLEYFILKLVTKNLNPI